MNYLLLLLLLPLTLAMLTIIIPDSRGCYLDTIIDDERILVSVHSGVKLRHVANQALEIFPRFRPHVILLMAGINDIRCCNRCTRQDHWINNSPSALIDHLTLELNHAKSLILGTYPEVKVALGGIIGMSLNTYNRLPGVSPVQWVIDETITAVNSNIRQVNHDSSVPHPRLILKVHRWHRGNPKNTYSRLWDGLHPSELVLEACARQIKIFHAEWGLGPCDLQ